MLSDTEWTHLQRKLRLTDRKVEALQGLFDEPSNALFEMFISRPERRITLMNAFIALPAPVI